MIVVAWIGKSVQVAQVAPTFPLMETPPTITVKPVETTLTPVQEDSYVRILRNEYERRKHVCS